MSEHSQLNQLSNGGATLSAGGSLAKILESEELEVDWRAREAAFGFNTSELFAFFDPQSLSLRTAQHCLFEDSIRFCVDFPPAGLMRSGRLFARPILLCRTVENDCSLLPTPTASMGKRGWGLSKTGRLRYSRQIYDNAMRHGYKPPITLLEWMMGFEENHTAIADTPSAMPSCPKSQNGLETD